MKMIAGVVGAGTMGTGIAQLAAMSGWEVRWYDIDQKKITASLQDITKSVGKLASKGVISMDNISAIIGQIYVCESIDTFADCEIVIEAIAEDLTLKKEIFREIESKVNQYCLLATNTSSLSVTSIAAAIHHPERLLGIHFFNPVVLMQLTEIIPGIQTNDNTINKAVDIISSWGKTIVKAQDTPGFIVNKVARPYYSEAIKIKEEGIADISTIDQIMKMNGFKMGPFELMDFIGHDVNYRVTESVWKAYYFDSRYRPSFSQLRLLEAGYLGKKTNKGFYDYPIIHQEKKIAEAFTNKIFMRIISMLINEAADTLYHNICSIEDLEKSVYLGLNYPKGLMAWGQEIGYSKIISTLDGLFSIYHEERYRVCPMLRTMVGNF